MKADRMQLLAGWKSPSSPLPTFLVRCELIQKRNMIKSKTIDDCMELSKQIGFPFTTLEVFIVDCLHWLKKEFEDIHIEYHKDTGWQVSSCYADESWDGWISGDGTLITALYEAVKAGLKQKNKKL